MKKNGLLINSLIVVALLFLFSAPELMGNTSANSTTNSPSTSSSFKVLCSTAHLPGLKNPTGIYSAKGGAFVEDQYGDILWCSSATTKPKVVAHAPHDAKDQYYFGMAGMSTSSGTTLILSDSGEGIINAGFYMCIGATPSGCENETGYIALPLGFCSRWSITGCRPYGLALDKNLDVYYVDPTNGVAVECTFASGYQACSVLETLGQSGVPSPIGIFLDSKGNIWVSDFSCNGFVWENGQEEFSLGGSLGAITMSSDNPAKTPSLYVAVIGACGTFNHSFIYDATDHKALPSPLSPSTTDEIYGLSTALQFTSFDSQKVYALS